MTLITSIGWSDFARKNSIKGSGNSYTLLSEDELVKLVKNNWHLREPGLGETGLDRKVVVPVPPNNNFRCSTIIVNDKLPVSSRITRRKGQEDESLYVQSFVRAEDIDRLGYEPEPAKFVKIVCYSKDALLENNGTRSTDCDFEIVCIVASPVKDEPMTPLTMARNQLQMVGGTKSHYTSEQWAESVWYWSQRIRIVSE